MGKHNELQTPLLDWTHSPAVGLFFAYSDAKKYGTYEDEPFRVVFRLNRDLIEEVSDEAEWVDDEDDEFRVYGSPHRFSMDKYSMEFIDPLTHDNNRLLAQRGAFTLSTKVRLKRHLPLTFVE